MALSFPNSSRSYDTTRRAVRFWGYDSAMETSFFVTEDALKRFQPSMAFDQNGALRVFDVNRDRSTIGRKHIFPPSHFEGLSDVREVIE